MSKVLYIIGIVLSVVFLVVCGYYIEEVSSAQFMSYYSYSSYDSLYNSMSTYSDGGASDLTTEAGLISLVFFLFFIFADIAGIVKVKTTTMKVFGIIGVCISGLFLLWDVMMISSPGALSFDEVGAGFVFYCLIMLAFSIVGLVQSINYNKKKSAVGNSTQDLLDS